MSRDQAYANQTHVPDQQEPQTHATPARLRTATQAALVALAVYITVEALSLGLWTSFGPGPGFFPFALAVALGVLSVAWFAQSRAGRETAAAERPDLRHAAVVLVSLLVLAGLLDLLGYQVSMFLFLMFHLKWRAERGWALSLVLSVAGSAGVFHGFEQGLLVQLPASAIPFLAGLGL
ncbi:tripartite tricarboxylate transporter TctB family protein [Streptosporangium sp. KLBMP 9127]|nr:tripartite tricarboxylate transporter TctB family protein [Streptosporangium sp. KLBMP 9127]